MTAAATAWPDEARFVEAADLADLQAEERFLAWCLIDHTALDQVPAEALWCPENREIAAALKVLREARRESTQAAVLEQLRRSGRLTAAGGEARIRELFERVEPAPGGRTPAAIKRLAVLREARGRSLEAATALGRRDVPAATAALQRALKIVREAP